MFEFYSVASIVLSITAFIYIKSQRTGEMSFLTAIEAICIEFLFSVIFISFIVLGLIEVMENAWSICCVS